MQPILEKLLHNTSCYGLVRDCGKRNRMKERKLTVCHDPVTCEYDKSLLIGRHCYELVSTVIVTVLGVVYLIYI